MDKCVQRKVGEAARWPGSACGSSAKASRGSVRAEEAKKRNARKDKDDDSAPTEAASPKDPAPNTRKR